jgi:hypothetical protein
MLLPMHQLANWPHLFDSSLAFVAMVFAANALLALARGRFDDYREIAAACVDIYRELEPYVR